jgi:tRNA pseudouridine38-40 synthase
LNETLSLFEIGAVRAAPRGPLVRVQMTIAYDGSSFHGFARQPGLRTVAGTLSEALRKVLRHPVTITGAGRTDRGVHAWGQVVTFDAEAARFDPVAVARIVTKLCGPELVVRDTEVAEPGFDARFSARSRSYRYTVLNRAVPDPFLRTTSWHVPEPLDLAALRLACDPLIGEHDFASFCRRPRVGRLAEHAPEPGPATLVRRVLSAAWHDLGDGLLRFDIEATAFCHQMVRSVVGTLVAVGRGRRRAGEMRSILAAADRGAAGPPAPPHGLCLWEVRY